MMRDQQSRVRQHIVLSLLIFFLIVDVSLSSAGFVSNTMASQKTIPFSPGEKLTFRATWGAMPAGEAILEVLPMATINGVRSYHFMMVTRMNEFIDFFYKISERQDSYTDDGMNRTVLYKKQSEGNHPRDVTVNFDWEKSEATCSGFDEDRGPVSLFPGSFDPLSLVFVIRLYDLKENSEIEIPVTDGKKLFRVKALVVKRETLHLDDGTYDTYLVQPFTEMMTDTFGKSTDSKFKIWFTADEKRIPVKIIKGSGIKSFVLEIVSAES